MVLFNSATSNFRRGGLTTRGGSSTVDLLNDEAPPTTNQNQHWWNRAGDWISNHSEGFGKVLGGIAGLGANIGDAVLAAKGKKPFLAKGLKDVKKDIGAFVDKDESSGFGKFVKGLTMLPSVKEESEEKEVKKISNGHVPTGYDRPKQFYINPSIGGNDPHRFSNQIANEWRKWKMGGLTPYEPIGDKQSHKAWKKWKKWMKKKKGKKGKKDKSDGNPKSNGGNPKH